MTFPSLESVWAHHENKTLSIATTKTGIKLDYPKHPFPLDLCTTIAQLPDGFRELALSSALSLPIITILASLSEWINQMQSGRKRGKAPVGEPNGTYLKQTPACLELVTHSNLSVLERVLCFALVAVTVETFNRTQQINPIHNRQIESLTDALRLYDLCNLDSECTMWMSLVLAGSPRSSPEKNPHLLSVSEENGRGAENKLHLRRPREALLASTLARTANARNWTWVKETVQKFFWDEQRLELWRQTWQAGMGRYLDMIQEQTRKQAPLRTTAFDTRQDLDKALPVSERLWRPRTWFQGDDASELMFRY